MDKKIQYHFKKISYRYISHLDMKVIVAYIEK